MSCLVLLSGRAKGRTYQVSPERDSVVGRVGECDICIVDPRMSRRHCVISAGASGYTLRDLGSANGVFLNNVKVKEAALKDTDTIRLGTTELEFHLTERFEDAETKRVKPGEQQPPRVRPSRKRKSARKLDTETLVEFCSRCSGSIPAAEFTTGKARRIDGQPICVECLAWDIAESEAAKAASSRLALPETGDGEAPGDERRRTSAEEVSRLAAEVSRQAADDDDPRRASAAPAKPEEAPVAVVEDDEFSTDALLIGDGRFDEDQDEPPPGDQDPAGESAKPSKPAARADTPAESASPGDDLPAGRESPPLPDSTAPTVLKSPEEIKRLAEEVAGAANRLENDNPYASDVLEPEDVIDLEEDDLPRLPDEGKGDFDEDAKTPRPGSQIRVL